MYFKVSMRHNPAKNFIDGYYRLRDWQTIDLNSLRNRDIRENGSEWLYYQALD
jgi:hypothetical protein